MKAALFLTLALAASQALAQQPLQAPQAPRASLGLAPQAPQAPQASPAQVRSYQAEHLAALNQAARGDIKGAIRALQHLSTEKAPQNEKDRVFLSMGRLDYEIGQFDNAIASYSHVAKTGPSWLESLEETAWAQFREGHPDEAIAKLKTVTSIAFKDHVRSEPFFLMGLAQLRVCDFKGVFKTIEEFKKRFSQETKDLEAKTDAKSQMKVKEIGETVQKLNLVEAETIQRLYVDENGKKRGGSVGKIDHSGDQLSFPSTGDDELWLDELDGYKVALKGCMKPQESKKQASQTSPKNEVVQ